MPMIDEVTIATVQEAARWLEVVPATIYLAIAEGKLPSTRLLGRIVIPKEAIFEYDRKRRGGRRNNHKAATT